MVLHQVQQAVAVHGPAAARSEGDAHQPVLQGDQRVCPGVPHHTRQGLAHVGEEGQPAGEEEDARQDDP